MSYRGRPMWRDKFLEEMTREELIVALSQSINTAFDMRAAQVRTHKLHRDIMEARRSRDGSFFGWLFR